ncbi:class I SAM-dependent methyltransferase fire dancer [Cochliomyia hominivorax]
MLSEQLTPSKAFNINLSSNSTTNDPNHTTTTVTNHHLHKRTSKDEHFVLNSDYKQLYNSTATSNNSQLSTASTATTSISSSQYSNNNSLSTKNSTKFNLNPMTKQLSSTTTPSGVSTAAGAATSATTASANGAVGLTNGSITATFLPTQLTPTIISPTASLAPATTNTSQYSSLTGTIPKKSQLQIPSHSLHNNHIINQNTTISAATAGIAAAIVTISPTNSSSCLANHVITTAATTTTSTTPTKASTVNGPCSITNTATTTTTSTSAKQTTPKKSSSSSSTSNDANGRSAALERAYVHDVYENCEEPTGSLRPRVAQFLSNLEAGSVVCDVGCGSGRYLTQCNPSICTVGVDRCYRLSRVAKEKGGEVALCDNLELPFRDESFDAVLSIAVVHHFATTERRVNALRELARILRIGGRVVITVWALEQRHRRFESQDVLIPWQPPKNRNFNYSDEEDDEDFLPPYHAYTEDSTNSSRSAGDGDSSSLSSSSPGESCYSFVRRAIQKLAGGRKHAWFLDSWTSKDTKNDSSLDYEDAKDLPIELRRLEDFEDFTDPPLSAGLKSRSLGSILNPPPRQIVRSRSSVPSLGGPLLHSDKNTNSSQLLDAHLAVAAQVANSSSVNSHSNGHSPTNQTLNAVTAASGVTASSHASSNLSRRPKLIKQKQSLCDEDYQLPDIPFHMLSQYNVNTNGVTNSLFAKQQSLPGQHLTTRQMRKQSSLNEELMAGNRIREKERVRKRIQKQMSLNEAFLCRSALFSKRLQVIREGFTSKIKSSTGSLERVTKTGINKIMQNLKTTPEEKAPTMAPGNIKNPKGNICTHEHHHHHHHYYQQQQQQHSPLVSNFQTHLQYLLHRQNTANKFAGPVTICKSLDCTTTACYCQTYHQACSQCSNGGEEEKARRHSRESGSDSSKDSSLQSDTSIESEDSFASVIFIPKPEQHQQQLNYQKQHQNSNSSSSNSSSSNSGGCHVHKTCCQSKCVSTNSSTLGQCCKVDINGHRISSVPTSPLIMPCPPTPAHSPAAAQTVVTSPPQSMPAVIAAMAMFTPPLKTNQTEKGLEDKIPLNGLNKTRFNFDEAHIKQQESKDLQQQEELKQKQLQKAQEIKKELDKQPVEIKITRQTIKDLPPIPKFRKQQSLQITRQSFPIVRRTTTAGGGGPIATIPKLMSLELFNPATDDLDSDSSEPSSPDSVDSVISAPRSSNLTTAPSLDQGKDLTPNGEKSEEVESKTDGLKEIETDNNIIVNEDKSDILPNKYGGGLPTNQPQDCQEFAEQLSAQLMRELEEKNNKTETRSLEASEEFFEDPFSQPRKRNGEKDLAALRDELRERRLMLANLSTQPSLNQSPNSSSTSSLSSQTRSFTIHEEDEDEDEEENERSYSLQLYENCKISKFNYKRHLHNNLHPETAYLLQDEDSSIKDDEEEELEEIEHDVIIEEDEEDVEAEESLTHHQQMTNKCINNNKNDSLEDKDEEPTTTKKSLNEESQTTATSSNNTIQNRNQSTESWEHSNSSTTSLDSPSQGGATTHHRYYHVFREGELDALINHHVASLHIVSSYYERASWCVVAEKVQVWTI